METATLDSTTGRVCRTVKKCQTATKRCFHFLVLYYLVSFARSRYGPNEHFFLAVSRNLRVPNHDDKDDGRIWGTRSILLDAILKIWGPSSSDGQRFSVVDPRRACGRGSIAKVPYDRARDPCPNNRHIILASTTCDGTTTSEEEVSLHLTLPRVA